MFDDQSKLASSELKLLIVTDRIPSEWTPLLKSDSSILYDVKPAGHVGFPETKTGSTFDASADMAPTIMIPRTTAASATAGQVRACAFALVPMRPPPSPSMR